MSTRIKISELGGVVNEKLRLWDSRVNEIIEIESKKSVDELVEKTKATAPVGQRKKHYRDSIKSKTIKTARTVTNVWYVDGPDYRLSHLLENGHSLRDGGRVEGTHFIKKATDPILKEYEKRLEEAIKNG